MPEIYPPAPHIPLGIALHPLRRDGHRSLGKTDISSFLLRRLGFRGAVYKSPTGANWDRISERAEKLLALEDWSDTRIPLELQSELVSHMNDLAAGFSAHLNVPTPNADCLGRPIKQPSPTEQIQLLTGHVNHGKTRITFWR